MTCKVITLTDIIKNDMIKNDLMKVVLIGNEYIKMELSLMKKNSICIDMIRMATIDYELISMVGINNKTN